MVLSVQFEVILLTKFLQMTAPISQGSSGGPVLNDKSEVIGISVATFRDGQNLNFAIPVNYLKQLAKRANIPITSIPVKSLVVPHSIKHAPASEIPIGETIPLTLDLISSKGAQQIRIYYTIYDKDSKELETAQSGDAFVETTIHVIKVGLQIRFAFTEACRVRLNTTLRSNMTIRRSGIQGLNLVIIKFSIVDDKPPTISVLEPPVGAQFTAGSTNNCQGRGDR